MDMREILRKLLENGVTIILITHYIEEAEQMADRIGIIIIFMIICLAVIV